MPGTRTIGLISDTHGLLRPEALEFLRGSDAIIHAGDIGNPGIIPELARLAPVTAIRGNIDKAPWAQTLPATATLDIENTKIYVVHDIAELNLDPAAAGFSAVIYGHSHKPGHHAKHGVLYVNPGSAGPRRFSLPISLGRLLLKEQALSIELANL